MLDNKFIGHYSTAADTFSGIIETASSIKIVRPKDTQLLTHKISAGKNFAENHVRPVFRCIAAKPEHVNADKVKEENGTHGKSFDVLAG